ncbi:hypothetical protein GGX14DRAFT_391055 [Mycena pura]|uniref:Uncharacterized protein n=1 Tax=Mycena pura TaxID=153505 RepID=A0AAD6VM92_9AGAR|nr:hypothetical protein GGX14DRAFT_391055 [Mycena pura]
MADAAATATDARPLKTRTGKRHVNPNWGGRRANSGRQPKIAKTSTASESSATNSTPRPTCSLPRRVGDAPVPLAWKNAPPSSFFLPRRNNQPQPQLSTEHVDNAPQGTSAAQHTEEGSPTGDEPAHFTNSAYDTLNDNLTLFIQENDEFSDIASGETASAKPEIESEEHDKPISMWPPPRLPATATPVPGLPAAALQTNPQVTTEWIY